jgi:hypothetical protein
MSGHLHAQAAFTPGERAPDTHWIGGWMMLRACLDVVTRKIPCLCRESNTSRPARSLVTILTELQLPLIHSAHIQINQRTIDLHVLYVSDETAVSVP